MSIFCVLKSFQNSTRADFVRALGRGLKKGAPSRVRKSEVLVLLTTLELGPLFQKGIPFLSNFGDMFFQNKRKKGVPESS